jgi:hypothetical protein
LEQVVEATITSSLNYKLVVKIETVIHYRKNDLCRVSNILPSVFFRALGKELLCRVPVFAERLF